MNRFDDALRLFEDAAAKHPQNLVALIDGSRALGARFEITRAEAMIDRLMKLGAGARMLFSTLPGKATDDVSP